MPKKRKADIANIENEPPPRRSRRVKAKPEPELSKYK